MRDLLFTKYLRPEPLGQGGKFIHRARFRHPTAGEDGRVPSLSQQPGGVVQGCQWGPDATIRYVWGAKVEPIRALELDIDRQ